MLLFSDPILLLCIGVRLAKINTMLKKEGMHGLLIKFLSPVTPKHFDFAIKKIFNQGFECTKNMKYFRLAFHGVDPREARKIINK